MQLDVDTSALAPDTSDATMHINIEQDHYVIKTVQESLNKLVPVIPETKKFQIGVYLPAHVSGEVTVVVVIIDSKGCSVGSGNTVTVKVTAGAASTAETVTVSVTEPSCSTDGGAPPPTADGGVDTQEAGQPTTDVASDTPEPAADGAASEVYCPPDAGVEAVPPPTCEEFCDLATKKCPAVYSSVDSCMTACKPWRPGTLSDESLNTIGENTIACRLYFVMHFTSNVAELFCAAAGPNSSRCSR